MTTVSKPIPTATKPRYHSRLGVVVAKEIGDFFRRTNEGWRYLAAASLVVPAVLAFVRLALNNSSLGAHAHDPILEDSNMRDSFPGMLGMAATVMPTLMSISSLHAESVSRSIWEPLLITTARRWELVVGRLLIFGFLSLTGAILQVAMLAALGHISILVAWCPFLSYFHPTFASLVELVVVMASGSCVVFAINNSMAGLIAQSWVTRAPFCLILLVALVWKIPCLWPVAGFVPYLNTIGGISAIFSQMPYDVRVTPVPAPTNYLWNNPVFWLVAAIGTLAVIAFVTAITIRSLRRGDLLANTAK